MGNSMVLKQLKRITKLFFRSLPPSIQFKLFRIKGLKNPLYLKRSLRELKLSFKNNNRQYGDSNMKVWQEGFKKNLVSLPENIEVVKSFTTSKLELIKRSNNNHSTEGLILLCVVKNDLERMKMFYDHYRKIGVRHFVIIDNNSDDGTHEWLLEQADSDIYLARDKFYSKRKYGWINKVISIYGFNRWYLYADSDELFVFEGIENHNIQDLIKYVERKKLTRVAALMVDMYSREGLFNQKDQKKSIIDEYAYFDKDSYKVSKSFKGLSITGGPRKRVLSHDSNWKGPLLIKHPLFYFKKGNIFESAHYIFPFQFKSFIGGALLHYKFIETDLKRYEQIAKEENFASGSNDYKQYIKSYRNNKDLTFMHEDSEKYFDSSSLTKISLIERIKWR